MRGRIVSVCTAALLFAAWGCGVSPETAPRDASERPATAPAFGDLKEITSRGTLRLARRRWDGFETLPRQGLPAESYFTLAEEFAKRRGLAVEWHVLDGFDELMPAVRDGLADVAVANITVTETRTRDVAFTDAAHPHARVGGGQAGPGRRRGV